MNKPLTKSSYQAILSDIQALYIDARRALGSMYWKIGQRIVQAEQEGKLKAPYAEQLILKLSKDLTAQFGNGFSKSNLERMRRFYNENTIAPPAAQLPLSHQIEVLSIKDPKRRQILLNKAVRQKLSRQEFRRLLRQEHQAQEAEIAAPKDPVKLSATRSRIYTYQILEPSYIHPIDEELVIDEGLAQIWRP